jgi:hypothetical protein
MTMMYALPYAAALLLGVAGLALKFYFFLVVSALIVVFAAIVQWARLNYLRRAQFIRSFVFPEGLFDKLTRRRPELNGQDISLVARGLRQYFLVYLASGCKFVSMPSQVVDDLWHEFILYTRNYQEFCKQAFGGFFHHTPAAVLDGAHASSNSGLRRCWWYACKEENIDPRKPARLPLLFALDSSLNIAGGFVYAANCEALRASGIGGVHCGGDFSDSSFDGSIAGFGDSHGSGGHGHTSDGGGHSHGGDGGGHTGCGGDGGGGCGGGGGD